MGKQAQTQVEEEVQDQFMAMVVKMEKNRKKIIGTIKGSTSGRNYGKIGLERANYCERVGGITSKIKIVSGGESVRDGNRNGKKLKLFSFNNRSPVRTS